MAKRKLGGLGKGLDSLFADLPETTADDAGVTTLPLREIEPDPDQPRKKFDDESLAGLAASITENGLLQPIAVRPKRLGTGYLIIAGERRWRAARLAGLDEVPVLIKDVTDEQAAALALIENLQREDLDPIEVAEGCRQLIEKYGLTQETAAKRLGKSRSAVTNSLRLLALPDEVRAQVSAGAFERRSRQGASGPAQRGPHPHRRPGDHREGSQRAADRGALQKAGQAAPAPQTQTRPPFHRPKRAVEVEAALKEVTGSEVHVEYKDGKGSLKIDFYSDDMLQKFVSLLGQYDPES